MNAAAEQLTQTASRITAAQTALAETRTAQDSEARALAELERLKADLDAGVSGAEQTIAGFAAEIARPVSYTHLDVYKRQAQRGISVRLCEMKPVQHTPAHHSDDFAELVCSLSLIHIF